MNLNWKKFPEATHYSPARDGNHAGFWRMVGDKPVKLWCQELAGGEFTEYNNPTMFESDRDRLIARPAESWTGEGLPPVGTVCELYYGHGEHGTVKILAHAERLGVPVAVYQDDDEFGAFTSELFRPIRTPEQIAADAREAEIIEIERVAMAGDSHKTMAEALYDAGYRKQVAS